MKQYVCDKCARVVMPSKREKVRIYEFLIYVLTPTGGTSEEKSEHEHLCSKCMVEMGIMND